MKHWLVVFLFNLVSVITFGQKSGIITYSQTSFMQQPERNPAPADMPSSFTTVMQLLYNQEVSLYRKDPTVIEETPVGDNHRLRRMQRRSNNVYFKDLKNKTAIEQTDFFGKSFLISDSIQTFPWKISAGEQKIICGMNCMKATYADTTSKYVVFFTPQIPVSTGPDKYGKLPGMILEYQSARTHIMATAITPSTEEILAPTKGQATTRSEFNKIREAKMAEQKDMMGGGQNGNGRIIRN